MFGHDQDRDIEGFFECDGLFLLRFQVLRSLFLINYCVLFLHLKPDLKAHPRVCVPGLVFSWLSFFLVFS